LKNYTSVIAVLGSLGVLDVAYIDLVVGPAVFHEAEASAVAAPPPVSAADEAPAPQALASGPAEVAPAPPPVVAPPDVPASDEAEAPFEDQFVVKFPETGQVTLSQSAVEELRAIADRLSASHELRIRVIGHADERGDPSINWRLGALRALAIAETLQRAGFRPDQIEVTSQGEEAPVVEGSGLQAWAENRRAEIVIQARRSRKP
jgi:peptidoglycan-associated lipoprotein